MKIFITFSILLLNLIYAQPREALLIGNSDYQYITKLDDPSSHINRLKSSLEALDFKVVIKSNLNSEYLEESIDEFSRRLSKDRDTIGFLYYSGHGCQLDHKGYLIPTDVDTQNSLKIKHHALSIDEMLETIDSAKNRVNMLFLDACRDVPTGARGGTKGLGQLHTPKGTLVVYATEAGKIARDNQNFINALIKNINRPNQSIRNIGFNISNAVADKTRDSQIPVVFAKRLPSVVLNSREDEESEEDSATPPTSKETKYSLTINPTPSDAKIYIMNINPKYRRGMKLEKGSYTVKVMADGYKTKIKDIFLESNSNYDIGLEKKQKRTNHKNITTIGNLMWQDEPYTDKERKTYKNFIRNSNFIDERIFKEYGKVLNWKSAKTYCINLSLGGFTDWYLPSKEELIRLYKDKDKLNNIIYRSYWSSTMSNQFNFKASWGVNFYGGGTQENYYNQFKYVRCVRTRQ